MATMDMPTAPNLPPPPGPPIAPEPPRHEAEPPRRETATQSSSLIGVLALALGLVIAGVAIAYLWLPRDFFGMKPPVQEQQTPFIVGGILPLTGDGASFGIPIQQAAILAQNEINAEGGIGGHPIEIEWRDGKCEGTDAAAAANELLAAYPLKFLIGGACSGEFLASAPLAQAKKIISFSSASTNPSISDLGPYMFRTAPSDAFAGKIAAKYAAQTLGAKTAALIVEDKDYPQGLREVFKNSFTDLGGTIVADEVYVTGTTDFKDAVSRIKAAKPDVVYLVPQTPAPGVIIVKELKQQNVSGQYLTAEVLLIRDAVAEQGGILEGVVGVEVLLDKERPKAVSMFANYEREYGHEAIYPHFMGGMYDFFYLMKEAYEATDGSSDAISSYLHGIYEWDGVIGPITFDENGDPSLPYQIIKIHNSDTEQIDVVAPGE